MNGPEEGAGQPTRLIVTDIGEYIDKSSCERNLKLRLDRGQEARRFPFYGAVRKPMDPVLAMNGRKLEDRWEKDFKPEMEQLQLPGNEDGKRKMTWGEFLGAIKLLPPGRAAFAREVEISRQIGAFVVSGRMDFVLLRWDGATPIMRIVECKASRKDKTYHRVQVAACYRRWPRHRWPRC